jgi:hypothetical protein
LEKQVIKLGEEQGSSYQAAMVLCKAAERNSAREKGREPPPYSQEEIEAMRRWDLETTEGRGIEARLRDSDRLPETEVALAQ